MRRSPTAGGDPKGSYSKQGMKKKKSVGLSPQAFGPVLIYSRMSRSSRGDRVNASGEGEETL